MNSRSLQLTSDDLLLLGACLMSAKRRVLDLAQAGNMKKLEADEVCGHLDAIAICIQHGRPLSQGQSEEICGCIESVRRLMRQDYVVPLIQRRAVIDQCGRLIEKFRPRGVLNG